MHRSVAFGLSAGLLLTAALGCSNTNFGGASDKKDAAAAPAGPAPGDAAGASTDAAGQGAPAGTDAAAAGGSHGTDEGGTKPQSFSTDQAACLAKTAGQYNIVMVYDASLSQTLTDPGQLRVSGSKQFVTAFAEFAEQNQGVTVNIATANFSVGSSFGSHGWVKARQATLPNLLTDIDQVSPGLGLGTHYLDGLQAADKLFQQIAATPDPKTRNFLIFLTDGEPNGPATVADINAQVATLVKTYGAAMLLVGTGTQVSLNADTVLKGMALPNPGTVSPTHIGQYFKVTSPQDMAGINNILVKAVAKCN